MRTGNFSGFQLPHRRSVCTLAVVALLAACGGGGETSSPVAATPVTTPVVVTPPVTAPATSTAAPLVLSAATTASVNGTLNKAATTAQYESTIGNNTGSFSSAGPNDFCRVAVYAVPNSGNALTYDLEVVFSKTTRVASYAMLTQVGGSATFAARDVAPNLTGITVDVTSRRLSFANQVLGGTGTNRVTLNGSLEYPTNGSVADRANCG
jgi:hypothetical protein